MLAARELRDVPDPRPRRIDDDARADIARRIAKSSRPKGRPPL